MLISVLQGSIPEVMKLKHDDRMCVIFTKHAKWLHVTCASLYVRVFSPANQITEVCAIKVTGSSII